MSLKIGVRGEFLESRESKDKKSGGEKKEHLVNQTLAASFTLDIEGSIGIYTQHLRIPFERCTWACAWRSAIER